MAFVFTVYLAIALLFGLLGKAPLGNGLRALTWVLSFIFGALAVIAALIWSGIYAVGF